MPRVPLTYEELVPLYEDVLPCVVRISRTETEEQKESAAEAAGTGFVVHISDEFTVVAGHSSFGFQNEKPSVVFWDGSETSDTIFIKLNGPMNLIVANIPRGNWQEAKYSDIRGHSETVCTVVAMQHKFQPFMGRIICPRCTCINAKGDEIVGTRNTFTFNLPLAGEREVKTLAFNDRFLNLRSQFLGAPVFNASRQVVGLTLECGNTYDFKFGTRSKVFRDSLNKWLGGREWKAAIQTSTKRTLTHKSVGSVKRSKRN